MKPKKIHIIYIKIYFNIFLNHWEKFHIRGPASDTDIEREAGNALVTGANDEEGVCWSRKGLGQPAFPPTPE